MDGWLWWVPPLQGITICLRAVSVVEPVFGCWAGSYVPNILWSREWAGTEWDGTTTSAGGRERERELCVCVCDFRT